jgi:hypothetical protein
VLSIPCITTGTLLRLPLAESGRQSREELQVIDREGYVMSWALVRDPDTLSLLPRLEIVVPQPETPAYGERS